jgi:uncharacterized protein (TIGR02246 family)
MKLLTLLLILLISAGSIGQPGGNVNSKDEDLVRKVLTDFTDAWNKHDAKAFAAIFTEDADFTNVRGTSARGRSEIEKHHEPGFKTKWAHSHQKIIKDKIRFIKPDVAAVDAWWELAGIKGAAGEDMPDRKGLLNFIMIKSGDRWLIIVMHNMDLVEPK